METAITFASLAVGLIFALISIVFLIVVPILIIIALIYLIKWLKRKTE